MSGENSKQSFKNKLFKINPGLKDIKHESIKKDKNKITKR
jgi:hypothetical protein